MQERIDVTLDDPILFQKLINQVVASNLTITYLESCKTDKSAEESFNTVIDFFGAIWSTLDEIGSQMFEDEPEQD